MLVFATLNSHLFAEAKCPRTNANALSKILSGVCNVGRKPITRDTCCQMRTSLISFKALAIRTVARKWLEHCLNTCISSFWILEEFTTSPTFLQNNSHDNWWSFLLIPRSAFTSGWNRMLVKAIFWLLLEFHQSFPSSCKFICDRLKSSRRIQKFCLLNNCSASPLLEFNEHNSSMIISFISLLVRQDLTLTWMMGSNMSLIGGRFFSLHKKVKELDKH